MMTSIIEVVMWLVAGLVWWLAPPAWKWVGYVFIGGAFVVSLIGYLQSRRRLREAREAAAEARRRLDDLREDN